MALRPLLCLFLSGHLRQVSLYKNINVGARDLLNEQFNFKYAMAKLVFSFGTLHSLQGD